MLNVLGDWLGGLFFFLALLILFACPAYIAIFQASRKSSYAMDWGIRRGTRLLIATVGVIILLWIFSYIEDASQPSYWWY